MIEDLKKEFPNYKLEFTKNFLTHRLNKTITSSFSMKKDLEGNISNNLNRINKRKITRNAKIVIKFNEGVELQNDSEIIKMINANIHEYRIQIQENQITLWGVFYHLVNFMTNFDIHKNLYEIESADVECFSFSEELFEDASNNPKLITNMIPKTISDYSSDFQLLVKIREFYKNLRQKNFR